MTTTFVSEHVDNATSMHYQIHKVERSHGRSHFVAVTYLDGSTPFKLAVSSNGHPKLHSIVAERLADLAALPTWLKDRLA